MVANFKDFTFASHANAERIRSNVKKLVETCGLNASEFQII